MYLPQTAHQGGLHRSFRADGTLASTAAQLVLPVAPFRAMLLVQNISASIMYLEHGTPRALATVSGGGVTGTTITNAGFGYTNPPSIEFKGGYLPFVANASWNGLGIHSGQAPTGIATQGLSSNPTYNRPARAHCVLTAGAVSSIVIDDPGYGYINAPEMIFKNHDNDPFGCAVPSSTSGIVLAANGGTYLLNGTFCHTDQIALIGATGAAFTVEYAC